MYASGYRNNFVNQSYHIRFHFEDFHIQENNMDKVLS